LCPVLLRKRKGVEHQRRRALKILHTADVHLDCDSYGTVEQRQSHRALYNRCFETIIARAITAEVDVLLIAGDLFDHNRVPDETIAFAQEQLRRLQRPVVILPGNHDCLYTHAIYDRHNFNAACSNVQVITELNGQVIEFPDLGLVVWDGPWKNIRRVFIRWRTSLLDTISAGTSPWRTAFS